MKKIAMLAGIFIGMTAHADGHLSRQSMEKEIYQIASKKGLNRADITIFWNETHTGAYEVNIKCKNKTKCSGTEVNLSFSKEDDLINKSTSSTFLVDKIEKDMGSLFKKESDREE